MPIFEKMREQVSEETNNKMRNIRKYKRQGRSCRESTILHLLLALFIKECVGFLRDVSQCNQGVIYNQILEATEGLKKKTYKGKQAFLWQSNSLNTIWKVYYGKINR